MSTHPYGAPKRKNDPVTEMVISSWRLVFALLLIALGGVFLFNISWNTAWPLFLVALGVLMLFGSRRARQHEDES